MTIMQSYTIPKDILAHWPSELTCYHAKSILELAAIFNEIKLEQYFSNLDGVKKKVDIRTWPTNDEGRNKGSFEPYFKKYIYPLILALDHAADHCLALVKAENRKKPKNNKLISELTKMISAAKSVRDQLAWVRGNCYGHVEGKTQRHGLVSVAVKGYLKNSAPAKAVRPVVQNGRSVVQNGHQSQGH
ncbi:MAG TPA: hypothetical protein HPQ04_14390 [Rhodospirillaceae bacterium]|nr:hypothetical protein [Rhodospirillaceae bacterium]